MAGVRDRHNRIALNIASRLNEHLVNDNCEAFMSDMKIKVDEALYYYPDVLVTCDPPGGDAYFRTQPRLIVEVTSPSTARVDRHEKLHVYRRVESLQEYILVSQGEPLIEIHRRGAHGEWSRKVLTEPHEQLALAFVGLTLSLGDVYRNVRFEVGGET